VTALDPAITNQLKSMVMAALLPRDLLAGQTEERAELARMAGERLAEGATDRAGIAARVGIAEGRIAAAEARHAADDTAYSLARLELVAVDDYEAATALTEAEQQLETLYAITARLARLSLSEYL
jgi:flagellar hook-associated protein 3 FlgL